MARFCEQNPHFERHKNLKKHAPQGFPKRVGVDTYAGHPIGFGPGRLLRKFSDGSIGAV
jgi:hypothetical protein